LKTGDKEYQAIRQLKNSLAAQGFSEAITFSLLSRAALDGIRWPSGRKVIRVSNPLSQEQEFLRPTGLAGLMGVLSHNMNRKIKNLAFFEVGKCFVDDAEHNVLSLALTGEVIWNWQSKRAGSFYYLKGVVENCFLTLSRDLPQWKEEVYLPDTFVENQSLYHGQGRLAACGTVHPRICEASDSTQPVYFAEINLDLLLGTACPVRRYEDLPQYPSVKRDISFVTELRISARAIQECAHKAGAPFLINTTLFDEYIGKNIPCGKRSLTIALEYQKTDGTFTDDEIHRLHDNVCAALVKSFRVEFR
jgi:phenylalanyl-tRNA synthetase beta chain